mmetsp:Transcript_23404/g.55420  ORF Transcript_23404/g.55420 Transcript_23404/m.55420 type:complete len:292 (-) Transcript_23404:17-892(-)
MVLLHRRRCGFSGTWRRRVTPTSGASSRRTSRPRRTNCTTRSTADPRCCAGSISFLRRFRGHPPAARGRRRILLLLLLIPRNNNDRANDGSFSTSSVAASRRRRRTMRGAWRTRSGTATSPWTRPSKPSWAARRTCSPPRRCGTIPKTSRSRSTRPRGSTTRTGTSSPRRRFPKQCWNWDTRDGRSTSSRSIAVGASGTYCRSCWTSSSPEASGSTRSTPRCTTIGSTERRRGAIRTSSTSSRRSTKRRCGPWRRNPTSGTGRTSTPGSARISCGRPTGIAFARKRKRSAA